MTTALWELSSNFNYTQSWMNYTSHNSSVPSSYYYTVREVRFITMGIIVPLGIACNTFCLIVFLTSHMRHSSIGHFLIGLAGADITLLLGELLWWLNIRQNEQPRIGVDFLDRSDIACKITFFLRYAGRLCSSWITVLVTLERFVAIVHPLHVARISTPRKAKQALAGTIATCVVMSSFPLFTVGTQPYGGQMRCLVLKHTMYDAFTWVSLRFGELIIPSLVVVFLSSSIICRLVRESRKFTRCIVGQKHVVFHRMVQERQLTAILLTIAIMFVVIRLPYTVFYYINNYKAHWWQSRDDFAWISFYIYATYSISMCLSTVNYVINFFVYYILGSTFRREIKKLYACAIQQKIVHTNREVAPRSTARYSFVSSTLLPPSSPQGNRTAIVKYTKTFKVLTTNV